MADETPLAPFDEDSYYQDPAGFFAELRQSRPVAPVRMRRRGRVWFMTRYADVQAALADPRLANDIHHFPGGGRQRPSEAAGGVHAHLLNTDPPAHDRLRRLVAKAFTPRRVELLRPRAEEIAAGLLDEMAAEGGVTDLVAAYARPLPGAVLCELLGVPDADRGWISATVAANRDPGRFTDPDRLDLSRDASGHLAFGRGIHYCLGASLARAEGQAALGALLARFPGLSLAVPAEELRWRPDGLMHGLESLPVRLA